MNNAPTLLVLAAGMGSRYGGLKQIDPLGPNGEIIIDYSLHDAEKAGFKKVVFVIKRELLETFRELIGARGALEIDYAFQELSDLPNGRACPKERIKPWGTGHAVYAARHKLSGVFGVIGSDDFFGRDCFFVLQDFLARSCTENHMCMVGYSLENTLAQSGSVSRGVCVSENGLLKSVTERTAIAKDENGRIYYTEGNEKCFLEMGTPVSMNVWGFHSAVLDYLDSDFDAFLAEKGTELKSEYYLPAFVDRLIKSEKITVSMLKTTSKWYGVTNREDKEPVMDAFKKMHDAGLYSSLR